MIRSKSKFWSLLLVMVLVLAACGGGSDDAVEEVEELGGEESATQTTAASSSDGSSGLTGEILIDGSSTVFPITQAVAEEFTAVNPGVQISVGVQELVEDSKNSVLEKQIYLMLQDLLKPKREISVQKMELHLQSFKLV